MYRQQLFYFYFYFLESMNAFNQNSLEMVPNTENVIQITDTNQSFIENPQPQITYKNQSLLKFVDTMKGGEKVTYHIIILVLSYTIIEYSLRPRWGLWLIHSHIYWESKLYN